MGAILYHARQNSEPITFMKAGVSTTSMRTAIVACHVTFNDSALAGRVPLEDCQQQDTKANARADD